MADRDNENVKRLRPAMKPNLLGKSPQRIGEVLADHLDLQFRASQVAQWILHRDAQSFEEMSNLPKWLRQRLTAAFSISEPRVTTARQSRDGCCKYAFELDDGSRVEGVALPDRGKLTLCLSSQTGCALGCVFCVTGQLGAGRDLTSAEIYGQYRVMRRRHPGADRVNIVLMGMGEPLLNRRHVGDVLEALFEVVSPKRITVSSAGVIPGIRWLAGLPKRPKLAISLNATTQHARAALMPLARRYPLDELLAELRQFPLEGGRRITFEYILMHEVNDSLADAARLVTLLKGIPAKVNLIPFNEDSRLTGLQRPPQDTVNLFARSIRDRGVCVTVRQSRGEDIGGACGQLSGETTNCSLTPPTPSSSH